MFNRFKIKVDSGVKPRNDYRGERLSLPDSDPVIHFEVVFD
ncbi:MAG: hypothetical protein ACQEP7_06815 [bacterium]